MNSPQITRRPISGWGRYPVVDCNIATLDQAVLVPSALRGAPSLIARGNGRSYGDASLNPELTLDLRTMNRLVAFDETTGLLTCEGGTMLRDLVELFTPRGWFPPATPGTSFVTVAGMVASDVHGKNHHVAGSFSRHVTMLQLLVGEGTELTCSPEENADLFWATCGGMGLTGVILRVQFAMKRIATSRIRQKLHRAENLDAAIEFFESSLSWTYSVAWIDCLASGASLGRSAIVLGEHAETHELDKADQAAPFARPRHAAKRFPINLPGFMLNAWSVRAFNELYYRKQRPGGSIVDFHPYFYPLDALLEWNRLYGRQGFVQFQCVLPLDESRKGLLRLLDAISTSGAGSFLAVLKRMGPQGQGMLSFPMSGYTLALDFPNNRSLAALYSGLERIVLDHGGRLYLAKDALASAEMIAAGYPRLPEFRETRRKYGVDERFQSALSRRLGII